MEKWTRPQGLIEVDASSGLNDKKQAPQNNCDTALILSNLSSLIDRLNMAREDIGLVKLYDYKLHPSLEEISNYFDLLSDKQLGIISNHIGVIRKAYYLSEDWYLPILILILTNYLLVPDDETFRFRVPGTSPLAQAISGQENHSRPISSGLPVIYPIYSTSVNQLKTFIDKHSKEIDAALKTLPKRPSFGRSSDFTILAGQWATYLKREHKSWSFAKIAAEINETISKHPDAKFLDSIDANNAYNRFNAYLQEYENIT